MDLSRTQGCGPGCGAAEADTAAHRGETDYKRKEKFVEEFIFKQ